MTQHAITYHSEPVDTTQVPGDLHGFRTIFTAFHHFRPDQARAVVADAVAKGEGIGVFECAQRRPLMLLRRAVNRTGQFKPDKIFTRTRVAGWA